MITARMLLMVAAGGALGYAIAGLMWLTITDFGVGLAVASGCWVFYGLVRFVEAQSEREYRRRRDAEWNRRVRETRAFHVIEGGVR